MGGGGECDEPTSEMSDVLQDGDWRQTKKQSLGNIPATKHGEFADEAISSREERWYSDE